MHRLADPRLFPAKTIWPTCKRNIGPDDLEAVADIVAEGLREGMYTDFISARIRSEIVHFLQRLAAKCEYQHYDPVKKCFRTRVAALLVYAVEETVVGFSVLAESSSDSALNCVDLVMLGIIPVWRGLGYGAAILDSLIKAMSRHDFTLIVRCPCENQFFFAMLVTRGFVIVGRGGKDRQLRLVPLFKLANGEGHSSSFRGAG